MLKKCVFMNFSIYLPCSPPVGHYKSSWNLYSEVTSYEFYDNFGTHFAMIFDEKTCTEVVAVLTIRNVWVICSLVFRQLYRSPTRQTHWKTPYNALSRKIIHAKNWEKSFYWKKSHQISSSLCQSFQTNNFSVTF